MSNALTPQSQFLATLKLTSDWHIGLGAGRPGEVDRLVQRDHDGLPFIPAKTLTGIWRDTCETVALGLDNGQVGGWSAWVMYLFGEQPAIATSAQVQANAHEPKAAALSIRAAYFSDSFKGAIASNPPLLAAVTFIKPGIAIEAGTGCAKENFLRFEEMARAGATLQADCELSLAGLTLEQQQAAYGLLVVSTRMMTRLGGKRRRGAGGCTLSLDANVDDWLSWLSQNPKPPDTSFPLDTPSEAISRISPQWQAEIPTTAGTAWVSVPLQITTQSPLVIASRTLGNVVETLDYIPGTHLMRLAVQRLRHSGVNIGQAIAHQSLLVTNATLAIHEQRSLPVPLALSGTKLGGGLEKGGTVYNRLVESPPTQGQQKGERGGYIAIGKSQQLFFEKVGKAVLTHNTIDDAVQRPTQAVGGVYSYQAIIPNTTFRAELRVTAEIASQLAAQRADWWEALTGSAKLGQSKKDSYGQVTITALEPFSTSATIEPAESSNHHLTVWLLSDLLLRDQRLRPSTSVTVLATALSEQLGCELTLREDWDQGSVRSLFARSHRIESWQVRWGLPRPSLAGFAAGSCFVFQCAEGQRLDPSKLAEIAVQGIGDRRAEGFGQVLLNSPFLTQPTSTLQPVNSVTQPSSAIPAALLESGTHSTVDYARSIEKAAWRDAIQKAAEALTASPDKRKDCLGFSASQPEMSQLGSLRSILSRLQQPDQQNTQTWLKRVTEKRSDKWPADSLVKLKALFDNSNTVWTKISEGLSLAELPPLAQLLLVNHDDIWLQDELWAEAVRTLVLTGIRAHKRDLESAQAENNIANEGGALHGTAA